LWLAESPKSAFELLRREAAAAGVTSSRLIPAPWFPDDSHLQIKSLCELFLDTPAYNAHQTAADALWAGVPILTLPGDKMVSRVALSMQLALGVPRSSVTIASSFRQYEDAAVQMGLDAHLRHAVRQQTERLRAGSALFDLQRSVAEVEALAAMMWELQAAGLPPGHLSVPRGGAG